MPRANLTNVFDTLNGTAWAIREEKFEEISRAVQSFASTDGGRERAQAMFGDAADETPTLGASTQRDQIDAFYERMAVQMDGSVAVVPVHGTVMKRMNMFSQFSGGVSTEMMTTTMKVLAADSRVTGVVLDVDSPGGSVEGLSELSAAITALREAKGESSVKAVANDMMASAAYWIGSSVGRGNLYATADAMVGSIGVIMSRWDYSDKMEKEGVKQHIWRSGEHKALGAPSEPLSKEEDKDKTDLVAAYYENFVETVASNRFNGDVQAARAIADGRVYVGSQAVNNDMADATKTVAETVAELKADATTQERLDVALTAGAEKDGVIATLTAAAAQDKKQIEALQAQIEQQATANAEAKASEFIASLVADGKVVAALSDQTSDAYKAMHASLSANFDVASAPFAYVAAGSAAPKEMDEKVAPDAAQGTSALVAQAEAKGIPVAPDAETASVYESFQRREVTGGLEALTGQELNEVYVRGYAS